MILLDSTKMLTRAVKMVPALKYAVGVLGIVSAIVTIRALQVSPGAAWLGVVGMIVLMVLLFIFSRIIGAPTSTTHGPAIFLIWSFVLLSVAIASLFAACLFFSWPKPLDYILKEAGGGDNENLNRSAPTSQGLSSDHNQKAPVVVGNAENTQPAAPVILVEVDPVGLMFDADSEQKLNAIVTETADRIKECFRTYQVTIETPVEYLVVVKHSSDGVIVPRNEITSPTGPGVPSALDFEKLRDVLTATKFPDPHEMEGISQSDSYSFLLKVTFIPADS